MKEPKNIDTKVKMSDIIADFMDSDNYVRNKRTSWDDKEKLFLGKVADDISDNTKSQVVDPRASTMLLERSGRVTAQLPRGRAYALDRDDRGKNKLMNIIIEKWIYPNAKRQFPLKTKIWLMDINSLIYGSSFGLVDWVVDKRSGYIGPDLFLYNIRDVFPQAGALSVNDSDFIYLSTLKTIGWLEAFSPEFYEKNKDKLKKLGSASRSSMSKERISTRYSEFYTGQDSGSAHNPLIEIITRYERDKWITFCPEFPDEPLRVIENPHTNLQGKPNGELPIITKHAFPMLDDFFGMGEMERVESLSKGLGSLINLYLDGVKMSIFPPLQVAPDEVVASTIKLASGVKMLVDRPNQSVQTMNISPQGLNTFTGTYQFMLGAIQNAMGTSTTETSSSVDTTMGKTPQALKMQARREDTRDMMDRLQLEQTMNDMLEKMVNLQACKMETPLILTLLKNDIVEIAKDYPDVIEMFSSNERGRVKIQPEYLRAKYIYEIESGTSVRKNEELELQNINAFMQTVTQGLQVDPQSGQVTSPLIRAMAQSERPRTVDFSELLNRWLIASGINDSEKILKEQGTGGADKNNDEIMSKAQELWQQMGQTQGQLMGEDETQESQIFNNLSM